MDEIYEFSFKKAHLDLWLKFDANLRSVFGPLNDLNLNIELTFIMTHGCTIKVYKTSAEVQDNYLIHWYHYFLSPRKFEFHKRALVTCKVTNYVGEEKIMQLKFYTSPF